MKNKLFVVLGLLFLSLAMAGCARYKIYSVNDHPSSALGGGVVYSLPQTRIFVDVTFQKLDRTQAEYADYAEEFLGYTKNPDIFNIQGVAISSCVEADAKHSYYVEPRGTAVQVGPNHLLYAVGLPYQEIVTHNVNQLEKNTSAEAPLPVLQNQTYDRVDTLYRKGDTPGKPSYLTSRPDVKSLRRRAKEAAANLKQIQERQEELLHGESSLSAEALQVALNQLQQQQTAISQMFLGVAHSETVRFSVVPRMLPKGETEQEFVLFYFDPQLGLVDSSYSGAIEVKCRVQNLQSMKEASRFVNYRTDGGSDKKRVRQNHFKYRMAEQAMVSVYCPQFNYQQTLSVAQYGPIVDLPRSAKNKALFDLQTGNLIYYGE